RAAGRERDVAEHLDLPRARVGDREVERRRVRRVGDVVVDRRRQLRAPRAGRRRREVDLPRAAAERERGGVAGLRLVHPDDHGRPAAVPVEVLDGVSEVALEPRAPKIRSKSLSDVIVIAWSTGPRRARPTKAVIDVATAVMGWTLLGASSM